MSSSQSGFLLRWKICKTYSQRHHKCEEFTLFVVGISEQNGNVTNCRHGTDYEKGKIKNLTRHHKEKEKNLIIIQGTNLK